MRLGDSRVLAAMALMASVLLLTCAVPSRAQSLYGSIVGSVTDNTGAVVPGAVVPGAVVQATEMGTGQVRQLLTNETGSYSFPTLKQGSYRVSVGKEGFETTIGNGVAVAIDAVVRAGYPSTHAFTVRPSVYHMPYIEFMDA